MKSRRRKRQKAAEFLIEQRASRVEVEANKEFHKNITTSTARDILDEADADPLVDHTPRRALCAKANRLLRILERLDRENSNRRFIT